LIVCTGVPLLADIPMDSEIANCGDNGKPIVILKPNSSQVWINYYYIIILQHFI
jgi:hypothetical protein